MRQNQYFVIIGAQRSGSTLLHSLLKQHENICMSEPVRPEPKYFLNATNYIEEEYLNKYFNHRTHENLFGEKSTSYYEKAEVADRIFNFSNEAKVICILRDPVERAISNYFFTKSFGLESRSLEEVFLGNLEKPKLEIEVSVDPFDYLNRGNYLKLLKPYADKFKSQLLVVQFEKLLTNTTELEKIYEFLQLDKNTESIDLVKVNAGKNYEKVSEEIFFKLKDYYASKNALLVDRYNIDISLW